MVILQGAWMILATATWSHAYGADSGVAEAMRTLMRGYGWLGGLDEHGHGNGNSLLAVWGKLTVVFYLIDATLHALRGKRPAKPKRSLWWWALLSGLLTFFGMAFALWPTPDSLLALSPVLLLLATVSAGAAAWAVLCRRLSERLTPPEIAAATGAPVRAKL